MPAAIQLKHWIAYNAQYLVQARRIARERLEFFHFPRLGLHLQAKLQNHFLQAYRKWVFNVLIIQQLYFG